MYQYELAGQAEQRIRITHGNKFVHRLDPVLRLFAGAADDLRSAEFEFTRLAGLVGYGGGAACKLEEGELFD